MALFILLSATLLMAADSGSTEEREMIEMLEIFDDYDLYREMEFYLTMDEGATPHEQEPSGEPQGRGESND
ncbi:MAG: hypothetical protein ACE5D4_09860 [Thermodesulfobacteriota bacterium]